MEEKEDQEPEEGNRSEDMVQLNDTWRRKRRGSGSLMEGTGWLVRIEERPDRLEVVLG